MFENVMKISQKTKKKKKKKNWLSIEKNIIEWEKTLYYNYKKSIKKVYKFFDFQVFQIPSRNIKISFTFQSWKVVS